MDPSDDEPIPEDELEAVDPYDVFEGEEDESPLDALAHAVDDTSTPRVIPGRAERLPRDHDGRFDSDLQCIRCDYNLRGQLPSGSCPECGAPIAESMRSDRLSHADSAWLRHLRQSMTWLMLGGASIILLSCINGGLSAALVAGDELVSSIVVLIFSAGQAVLFCVGYWQLTMPEPNALSPRLSRPIARWTTVPGYALIAPSLSLMLFDNLPLIILAGVIQLLCGIAIFTGFCTSLLYLRHLAKRIPNSGLARQCGIVFWGWITTVSTLLVGWLILIVLGSNATGMSSGFDPIGIAVLLICPLTAAILTFFIWWMVLLSAFSKSFARAVKASRNHIRASLQQAAGTD